MGEVLTVIFLWTPVTYAPAFGAKSAAATLCRKRFYEPSATVHMQENKINTHQEVRMTLVKFSDVVIHLVLELEHVGLAVYHHLH